MALSHNSLFENVNLIPLTAQIKWDLCGTDSSCPEGVYTIFARFYTEFGQASQIISDSIVYKPKNIFIELKDIISKEIITPNIESKNIQTSSTATLKLFTKNLRYRNTAPEVKQLQQFLNTHNFPLRVGNRGAGSPGRETFILVLIREGPYEDISRLTNYHLQVCLIVLQERV